ncbi:hypothetical protein DFN09_002061 [Clostridium acetobutylicum]|nr:hypothetical protein [Clostridium acetobutylicum]
MGYKDVIKSLDLKEIVCMWLGNNGFYSRMLCNVLVFYGY